MRMAHLSDLHFGHHDEAVAAALAPELNAQELDLVVISGDFTQDGTEDEFQIACSFIDTLNAPVFAVPGNHDVPQKNLLTRLLRPYALYKRYIDASLEPFVEIGGVALLGLKTSRRITLDMNWSNGFLDKKQLTRHRPALRRGLPERSAGGRRAPSAALPRERRQDSATAGTAGRSGSPNLRCAWCAAGPVGPLPFVLCARPHCARLSDGGCARTACAGQR